MIRSQCPENAIFDCKNTLSKRVILAYNFRLFTQYG
jgi:hypothetical protein